MAWVTQPTTPADRLAALGPVADRVHLIEYAWLRRLEEVRLFAYRFDASAFSPYGEGGGPHAFVASRPVRPLGPAEPVGDLHEQAGIELRLASSVWPWWRTVTGTTVGFSGIRLGRGSG